jgi:serine/threonine protein kinase
MSGSPAGYSLPSLEKKYKLIGGPFRGNYGEVTIWESKLISGMKVAVKVPFKYLNPDVAIAEARKQHKLRNSTRIVRILDFVEENNLHYIVMEYCPSSLETMLKGVFSKSKLLSYPEAARIIGQVCEAIKFAHNIHDSEGPFVHGDIKPANILLDENKEAKLGDFGAARSLSKSYPSLRGSPNWMSPEVLRGAEPSKESDYVSLGLVAYTTLTGKHPFFHDHPSCLWTEEDNIGDEWFTPKDLKPEDVPEDVVKAIMALLSRNPSDRPKAFETLSIAVAEYSIAKMPAKPSEEKYSIAPATRATLNLEETQMLERTYQQARYDYYVSRDPPLAVLTMKTFLKSIKWARFKNSRITALADCWSFLAFMDNGNPRFYKDAVESAMHGLEIDPDHVNSLHARGYAYAQLGKDKEAKADLEKALEKATDPTKRIQIDRLLSAVKERVEKKD